jgi:hypothetical protein
MNLKLKSFYLLFLLNSICISAQVFNSNKIDIENDRIQFIIPDEKNLIIIGENSVWEYYNGKIRKYRPKSNQNKNINHESFTLIENSNTLFAVENGLGRVFEITKDSITRIDNSASLKNNYGNSIFTYDQNIISYGGYGFWKYHDYFTRYSWKDNEWFYIRNSIQDMPTGRSKPYFQIDGNDLFIAAGDNEGNRLDDVHLFNLNTLENKKIGRLNSDFKRRTRPIKYITVDNINYYIEQKGLEWLKVNLKENYFSKPIVKGHLKTHILESNIVIQSDSIFYICKQDDILRINSMSLENFKNSFINEKSLYISDTKINLFVITISTIVILIILRIIYLIVYLKKSKYHNIYLQKNYLTYRKSLIVLSEKENLVLRELIDEELNVDDIIEMKELSRYLNGVNKEEILKTIQSLNSKFKKDKKLKNTISIIKVKNTNNSYKLIGTITIYDGWYTYFWGKP